MKTYQEMAEAVFREGDARLAARKKRRRMVLAGGAVGLAAAVCLAVTGLLRQTPNAIQPTLPPPPETATVAVKEPKTQKDAPSATARAQETTATQRNADAPASEATTQWRKPGAETPSGEAPSTDETTAARETPSAAARQDPTEPPTTEPAEPSNPSGAASYNGADWTEAPVNQSGWARFPRWPGYEDKFWVYYDGRTYRCDPYAGRPLETGEYLCALSDCSHDFADEDGAGVYVLLENGEPVPVTAAVVIVFPDGDSYAMIRPDTD